MVTNEFGKEVGSDPKRSGHTRVRKIDHHLSKEQW